MGSSKQFNAYAILPTLVVLTAFILSLLCIFAGSKPGMMDDYPLLTLNTSRLGQNAIEKIDNKIMGLNVTKIVTLKKRAMPEPVVVLAAPTITTAPTATITLDARAISDLVGDLTEGVDSIQSEVGGKVTSIQSGIESKATELATAIESKASSIEGVVASKISSVIGAAQTAVVNSVNDTYMDMLNELDLKDFYQIHMKTTCSGEYVTPNGTNITIGVSLPPPNGTEKVVDTCEKHSALNPLILIRILYYIGIFFTAIALLLAIWATARFSKTLAICNIIASLPAVCFLALASAASHGVAIGVTGILNFMGSEIGLAAQAGHKFIALTWATTILVLVNIGLWILLGFVGEKLPLMMSKNRDPILGEGEKGWSGEEHEMEIRHPHMGR